MTLFLIPFFSGVERVELMNNRDFWTGYMMGSSEGGNGSSGGGVDCQVKLVFPHIFVFDIL